MKKKAGDNTMAKPPRGAYEWPKARFKFRNGGKKMPEIALGCGAISAKTPLI